MTDVTLRASSDRFICWCCKGALRKQVLPLMRQVAKAATSKEKSTGKIGGMFQKLGNTMGNLGLPFSTSVSKIGGGFNDIDGKATSTMGKISCLGKGLLGIGAIAAVSIGVEAVKAYDDFDKANQQYLVATKNAGESTKAANAELSTASDNMQKLGFNSTDTAGALDHRCSCR